VTSPQAQDGSGDQESPEPASPDSPGSGAATESAAAIREGTEPTSEPTSEPAREPGHEPDEARAPSGIRWADEDPTTPAAEHVPSAPADRDTTPPSGVAPAASSTRTPDPGHVVPDRTTGTVPTSPPGTAWPHPGYGQGAPPAWQPTTPGWAPPPPPTAPRDPARRRRVRRIVLLVVLGLVVVAAIVVALLAFLVGPRFARYDVLDRAAVERGVTDVVTRDWHRQITNVSCPDGERVRPGTSFVCSATVDGRPQQIPVDVVDDKGGYEVGQPR
jgi:hypothetical protein